MNVLPVVSACESDKNDRLWHRGASPRTSPPRGARFRPFDLDVYEPLRILGAGGFGAAFLCRHRLSGGLRVIKTIRTQGAAVAGGSHLPELSRRDERRG